jgi:uncharacterized protein (TIGR03435 family)
MRILLIIVAFASLCQAADLKEGMPAPPIKLSHLLQAPSETEVSWEALKGRAVVLEFWATWCAGCRDQIPHVNALEKQFRNKPVRFLSLTDEEPAIVQRFLKDYPISGWVGLDSNGQTFQNYKIEGRPWTILIDAKGIVRGIGNPSDLSASLLENLLAGKPVSFSREAASVKLQKLPEPFYQMMIRPAGPASVTGYSANASSGVPGKSWQIWGTKLPALINYAYDIKENRIVFPESADWAAQEQYDVAITSIKLDNQLRRELLQRTLEGAFQLKTHREFRETDVYVLQRQSGIEPKLQPNSSKTSSSWSKDGEIVAVSLPLAWLAGNAERTLGKTVVNETGLSGQYDFKLKFDAANPQSFVEAVRSQLGLEMNLSRRPLAYMVVDSIVQPSSW